MNAVLDRLAVLPRGMMTVAVVATAATALMAIVGLLAWMILNPRRARTRA